MRKLPIALLALGLAAGCSSTKTETTPDETVTDTTETPAAAFDHAAALTKAYEAYSAGDMDATMAHFTDDTSWEGVGMPPIAGKEGVTKVLTGFKTSISDQQVAARRIFVAPDAKITIVQGSMKGTNDGPMMDGTPATGKAAANDYLHIQWWNDDGKITKTWAIDNGTTVPKMLGLMPVPEGMPAPAVSEWPGAPDVVQWSENQANLDAAKAQVTAAVGADFDTYAANIADDYTGANFGDHKLAVTKETSVAWLKGMHAMFTEATLEPLHAWSFGDYTVAVNKVSMKHTGDMGAMKATNKVVTMTFAGVSKWADGKVVWSENYSNPMELMAQLMPPPATAMNE